MQNAVPASDMGVATASATFFRQMGGTVGVSVFLSILFSTVGGNIGGAFRAAAATPSFQAALADPAVASNPVNAPAVNPATGAIQVVQDSSMLQRMDPRLAEPFLQGFAQSMDLVFLVAACVIFVGFVLIWFLKEVPLRTTSGIEARQAEEAAAGEGPGSVDSAAEVTGPARGALDVPASAPPVGAAGAAGSDRMVQVVRADRGRPSPAPRPAGGTAATRPRTPGAAATRSCSARSSTRPTPGDHDKHDDAGRAVDGALTGSRWRCTRSTAPSSTAPPPRPTGRSGSTHRRPAATSCSPTPGSSGHTPSSSPSTGRRSAAGSRCAGRPRWAARCATPRVPPWWARR